MGNDNGKVGRKNGFTKDKESLLNQHKDVVKYLRQGQSVRNTMKLTGKSSGTVQKIKKILNIWNHNENGSFIVYYERLTSERNWWVEKTTKK